MTMTTTMMTMTTIVMAVVGAADKSFDLDEWPAAAAAK
jgi:hypothetical protein